MSVNHRAWKDSTMGWLGVIAAALLAALLVSPIAGAFGMNVAASAANETSTEPASTQPASDSNDEEDALARARAEALKSLGKKGTPTSQPTSAPASQPATKPPTKAPVKPAQAPSRTPQAGAVKPQNVGPNAGKPAASAPAQPTASAQPAATPLHADPAGAGSLEPSAMPAAAQTEPAPAGDGGVATTSEGGDQPTSVQGKYTTLTFTLTPPDPEARTYRFDYENTPWADVLADFSRASGLPFLNQPDPPITENLTYRSQGDMTYQEALAQINDLLVSRQFNKYLIKRQGNFLVIKRLPDWMREIPPDRMFNSFSEMEAARLDPYDVVLVNMEVPAGWTPFEIIDKYRPIFTDTYGTQVNGDRLELTGLVTEHLRFRDVVTKLVSMTDGPPPTDPRPLLTIQLKVARANEVQTLLKQIFPGAAGAAPARGGPGVDPFADMAKKIDILADVKNNTLLVKAPPHLMTEIAQMAGKLDVGPGLSLPVMKVIRLEYADPNTLSGTLKPIFMKEQQALSKPDGPFVSADQKADMERDIFPDAANNAVILIGGKSGVEDAERVVREWDKPGENVINEIIELKHGDANDISGVLTQIFPPVAKPGQPGDRVTPRTATSILLSVTKRTYDKMLPLIEKLDVPAADEEREHLVQPRSKTPSELASVLAQAVMGSAARAAPAPGRRAGQPGQPPPAAVSGGPGPRFIPDDGTGYLIVYCTDREWERIEPLLKTLDDKAAIFEPRLTTFVLAHASAEDVVNMLQQMFPAQPAVQGAPSPMVRSFFADLYNNTVQIFASQDFIDKITPFIAQLDIETTGELTIIKLEHSSAETIAPILAQSVGGAAVTSGAATPPPPRRGGGQRAAAAPPPQPVAPSGGSVRIIAEPFTNSLLVTAPQKELQQIRTLIERIEEEAAKGKESIEPTRVIIAAKHRPSEELVETLRYLAAPPQALPGGPRGSADPEAAAQAAEGLKIVASGQQVILDGPRDQVAKAVLLFEQIDTPREEMIFRKYAVNDAERDEKKLRDMLAQSTPAAVKAATGPGGGRQSTPVPSPGAARSGPPESILIHADPDENTLLVGARLESDLQTVEEILKIIFLEPGTVDGGPEKSDDLPFFFVKLQHRKAFDIGYDLEDVLNPESKARGMKFDEGPTEKTLMVRNCRPHERARVEEVIALFDVPESGIRRTNLRVLDSEKMPPEMLLRMLKLQYEKPIDLVPIGDAAGRVQVIDIHEGEEETPTAVEKVRVGKGSGGKNGARPCVLPVSLMTPLSSLAMGQSARSNEPAELLEPSVCPVCRQRPCALPAQLLQSLGEITASAQGALEPEELEPSRASKASTKDQEAPKTPEKKTSDGEEPEKAGEREFSVRAVDAAKPDPSDFPTDKVTILYDAESGKVILRGPEEELEELEVLIDEITSEDQPTVFRVFPLKYADVTTAGQLLEQIFNQGQAAVAPGRGRGRQQQQPVMMVPVQPQQAQGGQPGQPGQPGARPGQPGQQPGQPQQMQVVQQGPTRIKVIPDSRTKSLFVAALLSDIPLIVDVLKKIDAPIPPGASDIRIFTLKNLDATQVVQNLREVLGLDAAGARATGGAQQQPQRGGRQGGAPQQQQVLQLQGQQGAGQAVVVSSTDNINLTADPQTNTIIAKAPEDTLDLIGALIEQLDGEDNSTKAEMRRVALNNARAADVATIVKDVAGQVVGGVGRRGGGPGRGVGATTAGSVSVNADARTNSVILAGQSKDVDRVADIVKEMDVKTDGGAIQQFSVKGDPSSMAATLKSLYVTGNQSDIVIAGDAATGTVLVKAPPTLMGEIAEQIAKMDEKVAGAKELKTLNLLVADPEQVAPSLQEIFQNIRGAGGAKQTITIKGNKNNGMLYVTGADQDTFKQIRDVAAGMDKAPTGIQVRRFPLQFASAVEINTQLTDMLAKAKMSGGLEGVKLDFIGAVPDPRTNSLIVTGGPITFLLIGDVIKEVDVQPPATIARETRSYQLPITVEVNQVVNNIMSMFSTTTAQKTGLEPPSVAPNAATNMIIVTANAQQHEDIKTKIIDPIVTAVGSEFQDYRIPLKFIRAEDARATLEDFLIKWRQSRGTKPQDAYALTADQNSNLLLVNCTPATKEIIDKQLVELDVATGVRETRYIQLEYARADQVAPAMMQAFQSKTLQNSKGQWPVSVVPDVNSNTLLVTAMSDLWPEVEAMVKALDIKDTAGDRERRLFKLTYADPGSVSNAIRQAFQPVGRTPSPRDMVATADDWTTNSVVVTAAREVMPEIEKLIQEMDLPGDALRTQRVIELANSNPQDVANTLQQIFDAANAGRRGRISAQIRAVPGSTKIVAYANEEEYQQIMQLVEKVDLAGGREVHTVVMPELVPAKSVAEAIKQLFGAGQAGPGSTGVKAEYHEPTNTVLVYATQPEFEKIKTQIIDKVATGPTIGAMKIFQIPLKYAVADEVAKTLQTFFDKKAGVRTSGQNNLPPWMRGPETAAKAVENQVSIVAEATSNMLLVYCTEATKDLIDDIVREIDVDPSTKSVMEMVQLKFVDASEMLEILTEYLKVSKRSTEDESRQFRPWWADREDKQEEKTVLAGDMRLKAIESLNSIIVVGSKEGVADTVAKIKELDVERPPDSADAPQRLALAHANASELADTLTRVFNDPAIIKAKGASYVPPVIVAQDATNSLIVRAKSSDFNLIKKMAESLDGELSDEGGSGVRILPVPAGKDAEELALLLEKALNETEKSRQQSSKDYKPRMVHIGADTRSNVLLVSSTKAQFDEVERLAQRIVDIAPPGGLSRRAIKIQGQLTPQQAKEIIEQLQGKKSSQGGARGPRSDAAWPRRRKEPTARAVGPDAPASRSIACAIGSSMPVIMMQLALTSAVAQTSQPAGPVIGTIRPRTATTRPAEKTPEEQIRELAAQGDNMAQMTPAAREAFSQKLSGTPITVAEGGEDVLVLEGSEEDLDIIEAVLKMLDEAIPAKRIEYVTLKNASAKELAKTLSDVFTTVEKRGRREVRPEDKVDIIADPRTNGLYIAATEEKMEQALLLVRQNEESAPNLDKNVRSFVLKNRRVTEAGEILQKMVAAYLKQKGVTETAQIGVEIDPQTNSILVTAGESDMQFVEKVISGLDAELPPPDEEGRGPIGEADVMILPLRVAQADTLGTLLNELLKKAATGDTPMKDFIRRFRLLDELGEPLATVNLDRPIVVFGDKDSNSLLIASSRQNCLIMKQVVAAFDKEPARAEVAYRVFTLRNGDATEIAEQIGKLLTEGENLTKRPGKGEASGVPDGQAGSLVYKAVVTADARTNQVVLVGRPEALEILSSLVTSLDVKGLDVMPFTLVRLEYASVTALEKALSDMMKERAEALPKGSGPNAGKSETVIIKGDPRSKSLIIAAKEGRLEELRGLIKQLDIPSTALVEDIRTITLKNTTASDLATKLKELWEQRAAQQEGGAEGFKLEVPAIVADERSNSLIVAASKGDFDAIKGVVDKIEALELNPMANIYVLRLKFNSAKSLQSAFKALFEKRAQMRTVDGKIRPEDEVAIEVDETMNALLFAGSRENYDVLAQKVAELDQELGVPGVVEFFVCENVGAARVKETLEELFAEDGLFKPGAGGESEAAKRREKVTVSIDQRANMLIVSASPENMDLIREIYKRMNSVTTPWDVAITKMVIVEHGDSVKIAAQVADYFKKLDELRDTGGESGGGKSGFGITVFADERSNRIIVGGTKDGIDGAVELIGRLDVPPGTPGQLTQVYVFHEAPAARIGEMIKNVFEERNKPRQGGEGAGVQVPNVTVTVEPDSGRNALLINASREDHILIADLVTQLDRPSTILQMARVIPLERAPAERVKEILEELYKVGEGGGEGSSGAGKVIGVVEDKRTNSVVVTAAPGELENIVSLVAKLDQTEVKGQAQIGVFLCENEDAEKMAEVLNQIMTGQGGEGGSTSTASAEEGGQRALSSMLITYADKDRRGRDIFLKTIRENVQITFNARTNSIIAVAPPAALRLIESLVDKLDQIQKRSVLVKVFQLVNADATKMVELLEKMFAQEEGQEEQAEFQRDRAVEVEGGTTATGGVPTAVSQEGVSRKGTFGRPKTTFVPDERTNSIIIAGWPEDIDVVADVVDQLDSRPIQDRDNFVYTLVNQTADEMQSALQSYFDAEVQRLQGLGETVSPQRLMEQEVSIISHPESNQLIVSSSPRYKNQVISIIEQLDMAPPQVMIQVMIAEVTLDDRFEMGLEFALQELRFSETAVADANGILQSSHFDVVGGTDLGAAGSGLGGFSFTITGEDFNFLVRALQADSRLEVIQRPMIMCQDNQQATIQIGQSVPTPQGAQTFGGQTSTQVTYTDVGVILNVEPHINPDGFVYMLVEPEISSITDSTIQIAPGAFAPIFNRRTASTNVAVRDGETVVIGGLITTSETESESKVPLLGDIPGVGVLFRTTVRTKNRSELLIALTPKVVRTVEDGRRLSIEKRDESGLITDNMKQSPLFDRLRVVPPSDLDANVYDQMPELMRYEPSPAGEVAPEGAQPYEMMPVEPAGAPSKKPAGEEKPKYGPQAPKYGPMVPSGEDVVAAVGKN